MESEQLAAHPFLSLHPGLQPTIGLLVQNVELVLLQGSVLHTQFKAALGVWSSVPTALQLLTVRGLGKQGRTGPFLT